MKHLLSGLLCITFTAAFGETGTWYVDCSRYGKEGSDGLTEATAFGTIQEGVDAAATGETVIVLPGVYDQGASLYNKTKDNTLSRVVISNDVTVIARAGAAKTFIVGAADFAEDKVNGLGPSAVRCVTMIGTNSVLKGFTVTGGHVYQSSGTDWSTVRGGGVYCVDSPSGSHGAATYPLIVDCVISNNVATRGAGAFYGVYVRTRFTDNRCQNEGGTSTIVNGAACRSCSLYNCVIDGNSFGGKSTSIIAYVNAVVNCTVTGNRATDTLFQEVYSGSSITIRNSILEHGGTVRSASKHLLSHCILNGVLTESSTSAAHTLAAAPFGDFRPVAGSAALGAGDVAALEEIPAAYRETDWLGQPRQTDETVSIGAVEAPVTPAGGVLEVTDDGISVEGVALQEDEYFHAVAWPQQAYLTAAASSDATQALFGYDLTTNGVDLCTLFPDRALGRLVTLPRAGDVWSLKPNYATVIKVDAHSEAETEDGRAAAPFKTIQAAVDSFGTGYYRVIEVAEGDYYGTNTVFSNWGASSVVVYNRKVFLRATGDVAKTRLHGVRDTSSARGCGEKSARCLAIGDSVSRVGVSGFTFVDGTTQMAVNGWDIWGQGGAVNGYNTPRQQILDCIVTNCAAFRGSAASGGWWQRCLFVGNGDAEDSSINSTIRGAVLSSCVLRDNDVCYAFVNEGSALYSCSCRGNGADDRNYYWGGNGCTIVNSLLLDGENDVGTAGTYAGVFCETTGNVPDAAGFRSGAAGVVSRTGGDFRPFAVSPLIGAGVTDAADFAFYTVSDFENRPVRFEDGKPTIGAYTHAVGTVIVPTSVNVTVAAAGTNAVEEGSSFTVTVSPDENLARHVIGLSVDGVAQEGVFSHSFAGAADTVHTVGVLTSGDWYVDADQGSDDSTGFTEKTAKKTLAEAMKYVLPGDVVHAAEGTYADGEAVAVKFNSSAAAIRSRVVVSNGVTLVASGSRERTIIKGGIAQESQTPTDKVVSSDFGTYQKVYDDYGIGANPMRGVTLYPNAVVRGFTITEGRTTPTDNKDWDSAVGSAVFGFDAETSLVEDCLLTNNCASRATVYQATVRNSVFVDNTALRDSSLARKAMFVNVFATDNVRTPLTTDSHGFCNCTFIDNYSDRAKTSRRVWLSSEPANPVDFINSILLQDSYSTSSTNYFRNVINSILGKVNWEATGESANVTKVALDAPVLEADGTPRADSAALDGGDTSAYPAEAGAFDCAGLPRISNAKIDIGAREYDWRATYARKLGGSSMTVSAVSPSAYLSDAGTLVIPQGGLTAAGAHAEETKIYRVVFSVTGSGAATLTTAKGATTYAPGDYSVEVTSTASPAAFRFDYAPADGEEGALVLASIRSATGLILLVR